MFCYENMNLLYIVNPIARGVLTFTYYLYYIIHNIFINDLSYWKLSKF